LVSSLGCNEFAFVKSDEQKNRFKKQHFLNQLNKITDLKSTSKEVPQKIYFTRNLKEIFSRG
jgi:hypothetical protein